jgi:hypothetical protein
MDRLCLGVLGRNLWNWPCISATNKRVDQEVFERWSMISVDFSFLSLLLLPFFWTSFFSLLRVVNDPFYTLIFSYFNLFFGIVSWLHLV